MHFDGPFPLASWVPAHEAGVYAILAQVHSDPAHLKPIYIGQAGDLSAASFPSWHEAYPCWIEQVTAETSLFAIVNFMPKSSKEEREILVQSLVKKFRPVCNR